MMGDLMDDGENRALRMFLAYYGGSCGIQVGNMKANLRMAGFDGAWPAWCNEPGEDGQHLTKGGAQLWIRHLLSLEPAPQPAQGDRVADKAWAQFCGLIGEKSPYPGMIDAFERHYAQSFKDKDWRNEASVWAAAWKAAWKAALQSTQPVAQPLTVDDFEEWHKANFTQSLDRRGYTYTDASVRNRWIGWQGAHGIREVK